MVFVKRVVAGPGELVSIRAGRAVVNGVTVAAPFVAPCDSEPDCSFPRPVRVPADRYYVLGENRGSSDDSRFWGPVSASSIVGVVVTCQPLQIACEPRVRQTNYTGQDEPGLQDRARAPPAAACGEAPGRAPGPPPPHASL